MTRRVTSSLKVLQCAGGCHRPRRPYAHEQPSLLTLAAAPESSVAIATLKSILPGWILLATSKKSECKLRIRAWGGGVEHLDRPHVAVYLRLYLAVYTSTATLRPRRLE